MSGYFLLTMNFKLLSVVVVKHSFWNSAEAKLENSRSKMSHCQVCPANIDNARTNIFLWLREMFGQTQRRRKLADSPREKSQVTCNGQSEYRLSINVLCMLERVELVWLK